MNKVVMLIVCMVLLATANGMEPFQIPASQMGRQQVQVERLAVPVTCDYTGVTTVPPWLTRDPPWDPNVQVADVYDLDDQLISMAEDALGRIYVCYEALTTGGDYRFGIATSIDQGVSWDNRAWGIGGYDMRYPEIAITDDGKIWIWGSLTGGTYNNCPCFMRSPIGGYNDPNNLAGVNVFGGLPNFTYPEVVTWGNGNQFVIAQYLDTATPQIFCLFSHDSTAYYGLSFTPSGGDPEKASISVDVVGNDTILIHGIEYYDAAGSDWDVVCYLDTLNGSGGLYGWGTGNTNDDRYPSVFASDGYAYIAYQADVGGEHDIMFSSSTDYGENWSAIDDLTNDVADETYPRLYGYSTTIGCAYNYAQSDVYFNYSIYNGLTGTWLAAPERITDNSSANPNYHCVGLLYTTDYLYSAWEDTRSVGTDGIEIYTARRTTPIGVAENDDAFLIHNIAFAPNPFRDFIRIDYSVPYSQDINITVYDVSGKSVRTLVDKVHEPKRFSAVWDGKDNFGKRVSAGVYFCQIEAGINVISNKLILVR